MNSIIITYFIAFAIIAGIPVAFENMLAQGEVAEQRQDQLPPPPPSPILDDDNNNNGIIINEEICPPYCSPPLSIQELP